MCCTQINFITHRTIACNNIANTHSCNFTYAHAREHFVELVVTDDAPPERMHARLDAAFAYALTKRHEPANRVSLERARGDARGRLPLDVVGDFIMKVTGREPDEEERAILLAGYEASR